MIVLWLIVPVMGYLVGTIPSGWIAGRLRGVDVRQFGSGRIGATNVLRTLGVKTGISVLAADLAKGAAAAFLGQLLLESQIGAVVAATAAVVGHNWPFYLKLVGGRGVATFLGGLAVLSYPIALLGAVIVIGITALTRYVSLGSMLGALVTAIAVAALYFAGWLSWPLLFYTALMSAIIVFQHRDNIARLLSGKERKFGERGEQRLSKKG